MRFSNLRAWYAIAAFAFTTSLTCGSMAEAKTLTTQDYIDIQQLYARYAWALDTGDGPGRAAVFTKDGVFRSNQSHQQPEAIATIAERTTKTGNVGDRHLQYNIVIEPSAEGAIGKCYVLIVRGKPDKNGSFNATPEMYNDVLVKTSAGWRFKSRQVWSDTSNDSPYKPQSKP